jgi:hypothetical protein
MATDLNQGYSEANDKIQSVKTYNNIQSKISSLQSQGNSSTEPANSAISNPLSDIEKQKNRVQKEVMNQFDQLVGLVRSQAGNGPDTAKFLKRLIIKTIKKLRPEIEQIVVEQIVNAIGCSQQQEYVGNTPIYIKVKSVDLTGLLKIDPSTPVGKVSYESETNLQTDALKYPFNRQMKARIMEPSVVYTFEGASGQQLFDISFELFDDNNVPGEYFKVVLKDRQFGPNKVVEFLKDYYKRMVFVDFKVIFKNLMNILTGAVSMELNAGVDTVKGDSKFGKILARILGLCFDNRQEIDVSGVAKIGELDNLDNSFFEFTELDLIGIDQEVNNIQNRAVQFENCGTVSFPVNSSQIVEALDELNRVTTDDELINSFDNVVKTFTDNQNGIELKVGANFNLNFDLNIIKKLPMALVSAIFIPKVILPILVMVKSIDPTEDFEFSSFTDFINKFKNFMVQTVSLIGSLIVREIFKALKKEIVTLLKTLSKDLSKSQAAKKYAIILSLIAYIIQIAQIIRDWRQCKSVLDQILALFQIGVRVPNIPLPALLAAPLRPGFSVNKAFVNQITELQKLGIPTGDLPDGSPNLGLVAIFSQLKGQDKEQQQNGRVDFAIPPLAAGLFATATSKYSGVPI